MYTMLLDNVHKMVDGGLDLQPYVHPDCGAHYGVPFEQETPEMFVVSGLHKSCMFTMWTA